MACAIFIILPLTAQHTRCLRASCGCAILPQYLFFAYISSSIEKNHSGQYPRQRVCVLLYYIHISSTRPRRARPGRTAGRRGAGGRPPQYSVVPHIRRCLPWTRVPPGPRSAQQSTLTGSAYSVSSSSSLSCQDSRAPATQASDSVAALVERDAGTRGGRILEVDDAAM